VRKLITIAMCLILLVSCPLTAFAAATVTFLRQEYDVVSESLYCYGRQLPDGGKLTVSVGSETVEDAVLSTLEQEKIPVTLYCLVDCATTVQPGMAQQYKDILLNISSLMSGADSMVLATVAGSTTVGEPMTEQNVRDTAINTISGDQWQTNLYDGMSQALQTLQTSATYDTNRCLIVFSDGHDDGQSAATAGQVLEQIREAGIPVYTVMLSNGKTTKAEVAEQEQFAEASLGGWLSRPDVEGISSAIAAQRIWDSIKGAAAIRIGVEQLQGAQADQQLLIRYAAGDIQYEDTILVRAVDLPVPAPTTEPETSETTAPTEDGGGEKENSKKILLIGVIAAVLVIAGIVVFFLLRKKPEPEEDYDYVPESDSTDYIQEETLEVTQESGPDLDAPFLDTFDQTKPVSDRCHVFAVAIMHPEVATDFYLTPKMQMTFGRSEKADILLNPNDAKLSSCHGCFFWDGKMLLVSDRNSTNGTAVNGEICRNNVWLRLEEGAILKAGNYEYRINFKTEGQNKG